MADRGQSPRASPPPPSSSPQPLSSPPPRVQYATISRAGCEVFRFDPSAPSGASSSPVEGMRYEGAVRATYSDDGALLAVVLPREVLVVRSESGERVACVPREGVRNVALSPRGTFLLTWERMPESGEPNMLVWRVSDVASGAVAKFAKKTPPNPDQWPAVRWTSDEALAARLVNDGVEFFDGRSMTQHKEHISVPGLAQFAFEPVVAEKDKEQKYRVAVFVAERKGEMASLSIYEWPNVAEDKAVSRRKFLQAQYCTIAWSPVGGALVATASTDMDPTGQSYYGQSAAYILFSRKPELNGTVPLKKEGGVHDVAWSPKGDMFVIVHGFMPSMTTVFSVGTHTYTPKADVGPSPRNTAFFSPDGTCMFLGGFANLAGEMDFFSSKSFEKVGFATAHTATTCQFSPDSEYVACAICAPRRRVDNGYRIFDTAGNQVMRAEVQELYEFFWRPESPKKFPLSKAATRKPLPKQTANVPAATTAAPAPGKYKHPNATGWSLKKDEEAPSVTVYGKPQPKAKPAAAASAAAARSLPPGCVYVEPEKAKRRPRPKQDAQ